MVYDSILLAAILMVTAGLYHGIVNNWLLNLEEAPVGFNPLLATVCVFVVFFFLAHCWGKGGQTLGMRAWRLRVQGINGRCITLKQSLIRFIVGIFSLAPCGLGLLWMLIDRDKTTWYDRYGETEVILLPKEP